MRDSDSIFYILVFLMAVFISSVSQVILKKSANSPHGNFLKEYLNPKVIFGYGLFFLSTLLTLFAYRVVPLSLGTVLEASGYFWVAIFSFLFLKEPISSKKWIGLGVILAGIVIYNL